MHRDFCYISSAARLSGYLFSHILTTFSRSLIERFKREKFSIFKSMSRRDEKSTRLEATWPIKSLLL